MKISLPEAIKNFSSSTALSYIANKVRQGDREGAVDVIDVDGTPVLELIQSAGQVDYYTWIYYRDGSIRELFTREGTELGWMMDWKLWSAADFASRKKDP